MSVSAYAPNIVTMIGLGVAIDYSLFIVSRFREEITRQLRPRGARRHAGDDRARHPLLGRDGGHRAPRHAHARARQYRLAGARRHLRRRALGRLRIDLSAGRPGHAGTEGQCPFDLPASVPRGSDGGSGFWHRLAALVMAHPWRVLRARDALLLLLLGLRSSTSGSAPAMPRRCRPGRRRGAAPSCFKREFPEGSRDAHSSWCVSHRSGSPLDARAGRPGVRPEPLAGRHRPGVTGVQSVMDLAPGHEPRGLSALRQGAPGAVARGDAPRGRADRRRAHHGLRGVHEGCPRAATRRGLSSAPSAPRIRRWTASCW